MAFVERFLKFTFAGAQSGNFSAEGLRAAVSVQAYPGRAGNLVQCKVWGLSPDQMQAYSSGNIPNSIAAQNFSLTVWAGDVGGQPTKVVSGPLFRSFIDMSEVPESCFCASVIGVFPAASMIAGTSQPGTQNAEDLISAICAGANPVMPFNNNGAHGVLRNPHYSGSAIDQITAIAHDSKFNLYFDGVEAWIWPRGGRRGEHIIEIGPSTEPQMVGYPVFWESGIIVTSLFNPQVQVGYQMDVTSSILKSCGLWNIVQVEHDLTTMISGGPWFTRAYLVAPTL